MFVAILVFQLDYVSQPWFLPFSCVWINPIKTLTPLFRFSLKRSSLLRLSEIPVNHLLRCSCCRSQEPAANPALTAHGTSARPQHCSEFDLYDLAEFGTSQNLANLYSYLKNKLLLILCFQLDRSILWAEKNFFENLNLNQTQKKVTSKQKQAEVNLNVYTGFELVHRWAMRRGRGQMSGIN